MDVNETLSELRKNIAAARNSQDDGYRAMHLDRVVIYAEALDDWLRMGGALPTAWDHNNPYKLAKGR